MGMTEGDYLHFQLNEQLKIVKDAYRKDPKNTSYVFYGSYGKVTWTRENGEWGYALQPPRTKKK